MCYSVYIIYSESADSFYKGQTENLCERLTRHNKKIEKATKSGIPWRLIWSTNKSTRSSALKLEQKLKNLSRKRLINFMLTYSEGVAGPDEFLQLEKLSGC
jgi:putative endonuclease